MIILLALLVSACAVKVIPQATATARINPADNSLSESRDGITITARLDELSVAPYRLVDNITSFYIVVDNGTTLPIEMPVEYFVLRDADGRQYRTITPERVREIVSKDTVYLIPYPYVGYYYLEDHMKVSQFDTFSSSLPFYAEYHPQDIFTRALPQTPVMAGAKIAGVIYFIADLERTSAVQLLVFDNPDAQGEPRYLLPFAIAK
ncbi:MAG: hypothetical protein RQ723_04750 [Desulfuromonadales bacterium]|nr:hypothetical protein [Desulfuromonadales bacterium]